MPSIPNKAFKVEFDDDDHIDLSMTEGGIDVSSGRDEWLQSNKIGLIGQEGDWRFDPNHGLPWVDNGKLAPGRLSIMGGEADASLIEIYIYQQLGREPRNETIEDVNVEWDEKQIRKVRGEATIKSVDGDLEQVEV